jgi:hypothetical protein
MEEEFWNNEKIERGEREQPVDGVSVGGGRWAVFRWAVR